MYVLDREQAKDDNKKPEVMEKIIAGKVSKRLGEISLIGQTHVVEEGKPIVGKHLELVSRSVGHAVGVDAFCWWSLGQR